jgi:ATP-dependent RNA helicase DDX5/DBP2
VEAAKFAPAVRSRVVAIYGGVGKVDQLRDLRKGADIVIATPGRLIDFCNGAKGREDLGPSIDLKNVKYLILDEADRMLDMGFEPDIQKIASKCPDTKNRQTMFFTATWPKAVKAAAASLTGSATVQLRIGQNAGSDKLQANKDVKQTVLVMRRDEKLAALKKILKEQLASGETAFVFGSTKAICDSLEAQLGGSNNHNAELGFWCRAIHSGKEQWDRDEALAQFRNLTTGTGSEKGVLIATDVAARGLDIPGVALVVIYDFGSGPRGNANNAVESYVHKIGRTGRAGKTGRAFTLFTSDDHGAHKLCELLRGANQEVPRELDELAWQNPKQAGFSKGKGKGKGKGGGKGFSKGKGKGKGWGHRW